MGRVEIDFAAVRFVGGARSTPHPNPLPTGERELIALFFRDAVT
jgi:hypothetical protein